MERNKDNALAIMIGLVLAAIVVYVLFSLFGGAAAMSQSKTVSPNQATTASSAVNTPDDITTSNTSSDTAFVIRIADLPEAQQSMLRATGIKGDDIVITNAMKTCAESSVGVDRTAEISKGATPSVIEGTKLVACYSQN